MRIAYANASYHQNHTGGGQVHMEQFISSAIDLGHEVWAYSGNKYPGVNIIPADRLNHIKTLRRMDAFYVRIDSGFPSVCRYSLPPRRWLYRLPVVVWEFNTAPEHGLLRGLSTESLARNKELFAKYGKGVDLAVCVSEALGDYVKTNFGIEHVKVVPNGSDPGMFNPDAPVVSRLAPFKDKVNVVWIGSGKEPWHDLTSLKESARIIASSPLAETICFHIIGPDLTGVMGEMPGNVYFWGAENYHKLPNWLSGLDIGLVLYHEGPANFNCPLKLFDYLSSSLAVISTPQPFVNQLFSNLNQNDLVVPFGDSHRLAEVILELAGDRERVRRLGLAGRQLVIDQYNWQRAVRDTMTEIETLLKRKMMKLNQ